VASTTRDSHLARSAESLGRLCDALREFRECLFCRHARELGHRPECLMSMLEGPMPSDPGEQLERYHERLLASSGGLRWLREEYVACPFCGWNRSLDGSIDDPDHTCGEASELRELLAENEVLMPHGLTVAGVSVAQLTDIVEFLGISHARLAFEEAADGATLRTHRREIAEKLLQELKGHGLVVTRA